jgi:hypothetical protein
LVEVVFLQKVLYKKNPLCTGLTQELKIERGRNMVRWEYGMIPYHVIPLVSHGTSLHNILLPKRFDSIMPRALQPGRLSRNMRVHYTARRKLGLLASAKRIMEEEGVTL